MGVPERVFDWPTKLLAVIEEHQYRLFDWAKTNCVTFALDSIRAVVGVLPTPLDKCYAALEGVQNEDSAKQVLVGLGYKSTEEPVSKVFTEIPTSLAQRGDLGFLEHNGWMTPVIMMNDGFTGHLEAGLVHLPRRLVLRAYKVG